MEHWKVLGGSKAAKGTVGSVVIVEVLEGIQDWIYGLDISRQVVDGIELVSPAPLQCSTAPFIFGDLGGRT